MKYEIIIYWSEMDAAFIAAVPEFEPRIALIDWDKTEKDQGC